LDLLDLLQPGLLGDPRGGRVSWADQTYEQRQAQSAEGVVANGARRFTGVSAVPTIAAKVVPELGHMFPGDLHQFEPAIPDQAIFALRTYGEKTVAVLPLVREIPL
jgi:hypothetical protein